jgi:hypothetical protein
MGIRKEIERKIEKKEHDMLELQQETTIRLREGRAYVQALQESLKLLPKESFEEPTVTLRPGSAVAKARDAITAAGKPLHVSEILKVLGKPITPVGKAGLSGSLAWYVRKGEIFTRPAPNTFGLVELNGTKEATKRVSDSKGDEPPENFGLEDIAPIDEEEIPF